MDNKAREINSPVIKQLLDETKPEELAKIDAEMTKNKQQTTVEWLAEQMEILHYDYWAEHISKDEKNQRLKQLKEQAKEMEKEQMDKVAEDWWNEGARSAYDGKRKYESFEQYYQQTYGGGEQ
jgi:hypothetical protein